MDVIYKIAENNAEKDAAKNLIEQVFIKELGYSKMLSDKFDSIAIFLVATCNGHIIAALRLIPDSELELPLDNHIDLTGLRNESIKLAELSRLACLQDFRNNHVAINGLRFLMINLFDMGISHVVIDSFLHSARLYKRLGFKPLGKPIFDPTIYKEGDNPGVPNSLVMYAKVQDLNKKNNK